MSTTDQAPTRELTAQAIGSMIEIVDDDDVREYQFQHPDTKVLYNSWFTLSVVPPSEQRRLRKKHTTFENTRSGRVENFDWQGFTDDCLDFAIKAWRGVCTKGVELLCARENKLRLPEIVRAELARLCIGKELGEIRAGNVAGGPLTDPTTPSGNS